MEKEKNKVKNKVKKNKVNYRTTEQDEIKKFYDNACKN